MQAERFSDAIIDRFFRPFLGGIFFDRDLNVTSRLFEFVMRCLATGQNCLPSRGIGAVGEQLAGQLPPDAIHTGAAYTIHLLLGKPCCKVSGLASQPRCRLEKSRDLQANLELMPSTQMLESPCIW